MSTTARSFSLKRFFIALIILALIVLVFLSLAPLPKATMGNCESHNGQVAKVARGDGDGDIVIRLVNDENYYYINRAINSGLSVDDLSARLNRAQVLLLTVKHWTPLDPASTTKHVSQLKVGPEIIYNEIQ